MRPTPGSTAGQDPGASATTFFPSKLSLSQHACLVVLFFSFWYRNRHHTVNQRCLPVEVTRTRCRNSFLNKFTTIRPPNLWIATRPGRLSHASSQGLETDCLSTRFIYNETFSTGILTVDLYRFMEMKSKKKEALLIYSTLETSALSTGKIHYENITQ